MKCICGNGSDCFCGTTSVNPSRDNAQSELVKAAEEVLEFMVDYLERDDLTVIQELRAALAKVK